MSDTHINHDDRIAVQWTRADKDPSKTGWYYQTDSLGRHYGTKSSVVASLAFEYKRREKWCVPLSHAGWAFRTLLGMDERPAPAQTEHAS